MSGATPPVNSSRRPSTTPASSSSGPSNLSSSPAKTTTPKSKNGAPPSAKAAAKRTAAKDPPTAAEEDAKAETASLLEDLKEQLRKTESASQEYQKQLLIAQSRLDEALAEQNKLEETTNQHAQTVASLESQIRDVSKQKTELETQRTADEVAWTTERDAATARETEMQDIIKRLKENLTQRESRQSVDGGESKLSRTESTRGRSSPKPDTTAALGAPPLSRRDSSQQNAKLMLQKDRVIEELRLELAEAHIKVMEVDRAGGGRLQELEKKLLEVRMANAKLMEDNESYQFLLQERTLNGDFTGRFRATTPSEKSNISRDAGSSSLADELETAGAATDIEEAKERLTIDKAEKEIASLEDQNKAMKLYIDKIIGKLLASEHYEAVLGGPSVAGGNTGTPSPTERKTSATGGDEAGKENMAPSLLQRAGSIFGGRVRPSSYLPGQVQASSSAENPLQGSQGDRRAAPTANENPTTAPSVPLRRGEATLTASSNPRYHRRSNSDWSAATPVPASSYTTRTPSTGDRPTTPTYSSPKHASILTSSPPAGSVILEDNDPATNPSNTEADISLTSSNAVSDSGYGDNLDATNVAVSPPRSIGASSNDGGRSVSGGGGAMVSSGRQMRPLRLVKEKEEADAEKKRQNRMSWMPGWFKGPAAPGTTGPPGSQTETRPWGGSE